MNILSISLYLLGAFLFNYGRLKDKPLSLAISQVLFFIWVIYQYPNEGPITGFFVIVVFFTIGSIKIPRLYNTILTLIIYIVTLSLEIFNGMINADSLIDNKYIFVSILSVTIISSMIGVQTYILRSCISRLQIKILIIVNALVSILGIVGFARL